MVTEAGTDFKAGGGVEDIAAIFGVFGLLALIVGLVMFIPIPFFRTRRRLAKWLCLGGLGAFVAGMILTPGSAGKHAAKNTKLVSKAGVSAPTSSRETPSTEEGKNAFVALYRQVLAAGEPCDKSITAIGAAAKTGDQYATYQVAKDGAAACREAATTIGSFSKPDGLTGEGEQAVEKALKICGNAYLYRQMGMEKAMQIADGDGKPSVVSEMSDDLKTGQTGVLLCVAGMFDASSKIGIDIKRLK